jgi:hypothetical protein
LERTCYPQRGFSIKSRPLFQYISDMTQTTIRVENYEPTVLIDLFLFVPISQAEPTSCTRACATTSCAWVTACTIGVEVILTLEERCISPGEEILEYCSRVVKTLSPTSPGADLAERPTQHYGEVLAASTTERVSSVRSWINADVKEVIAEALEEGFTGLDHRRSAGSMRTRRELKLTIAS